MNTAKSPGAVAALGASEIDIRSWHVISIINHRQHFWQLSNASQSVRSPASETERSYACVQTYLPEKRRVVCIDPYAPVNARLRRRVRGLRVPRRTVASEWPKPETAAGQRQGAREDRSQRRHFFSNLGLQAVQIEVPQNS
jgi:hypothetical protein